METQNSAFDMQEQQGNIAVHRRFNRDEANFALYPNSNLDDLSNVNLWREVAVLRRLAEAGVVGFQGVESGKQGPVLVFDDSGGTALSTLMAQQELELEECLCIGLSMAQLLARIHQFDVVHKDISPEHILWNRERAESAISDFSIASDLGLELSNLRAPQNLQGNLLYMSPEQTGRINAVVDCRSDLYSMGATLYHLLLGHPPFTATDPMALVHAHIAQPPADPATAGVSKMVAQIILNENSLSHLDASDWTASNDRRLSNSCIPSSSDDERGVYYMDGKKCVFRAKEDSKEDGKSNTETAARYPRATCPARSGTACSSPSDEEQQHRSLLL